MNRRVVIYDPNPLNPYGLELANILGLADYAIELHQSVDEREQVPANTEVFVDLPGPRRTSSAKFLYVLRRFLAPLKVVLTTPRANVLILVWVRDPWDCLLFLLRALLGGRTMLVYHNPPSVRARSGFTGRLEGYVSRIARVCVHSDWLRNQLDPKIRDSMTVDHPPYVLTSQVKVSCSRNLPEGNYIGFVGSMRPDKGAKDLAAISAASKSDWSLMIVGSDSYPSSDESLGREIVYASDFNRIPDDAEMKAGLERCKLMIAPYKQVTESGSVHLAKSLGVDVLAYSSPGLQHVLTSASMADTPQELGRLIDCYLTSPWPSHISNLEESTTRAINSWSSAVGTVQKRQDLSGRFRRLFNRQLSKARTH